MADNGLREALVTHLNDQNMWSLLPEDIIDVELNYTSGGPQYDGALNLTSLEGTITLRPGAVFYEPARTEHREALDDKSVSMILTAMAKNIMGL